MHLHVRMVVHPLGGLHRSFEELNGLRVSGEAEPLEDLAVAELPSRKICQPALDLLGGQGLGRYVTSNFETLRPASNAVSTLPALSVAREYAVYFLILFVLLGLSVREIL